MLFLVSGRNTRLPSGYAQDFVNAVEDDLQRAMFRTTEFGLESRPDNYIEDSGLIIWALTRTENYMYLIHLF